MRTPTFRAALVIASATASVLLLSSCERSATTSTAPPSHEPPASPSGAHAVTAEHVLRRGHLSSYASRDGRETLTVWELCRSACRLYWVLSGTATEPIVGDAGRGAIPAVTASRAGYVVKAFARRGFVVRPDGTTIPLRKAATPEQVGDDTVILQPRRRELTAVNPARGTTWQLPARPGGASIYEAEVGAGGEVWAIPSEPSGDPSILRLQGGQWHAISTAGLYPADTIQQDIVTTRRAPVCIAVVATYGHQETPPARLVVSTDAGRTWHRLVDDGRPMTLGDSSAIAGDTLFLGGAHGHVWRTVDPSWTRLERVPRLQGVGGLQPAGRGVIGWRWRSSSLVSIDPQGRWHEIRF